LKKNRKWTVLLIGGPSGVGKSIAAYEIGRYYNVNVIEVDDICRSIKAMTTAEQLPWVHYWSSGLDWLDIGVEGNVNWLVNISKEIMPGLKSIINNHLETDVPIIIEGDFIHPDLITSFDFTRVKALYINEPNVNQILKNYLSREGGQLQSYRSDISEAYGKWLVENCENLGIGIIHSRPWETTLSRMIKVLND
jgi:2-phosphoglycerate kinase